MTAKKYGVVTPEALKSHDGLGFLKAIIDGTLPQPPISEVLGFHLVEAENGRAAFEGLPGVICAIPASFIRGSETAVAPESRSPR